MAAGEFITFLLQISVMLAAGLAGGYVMLRIGQPVVLGEMLAGIVLGPTIVGWLAPDLYQSLFAMSPGADLLRSGAIKLGMLFFLFLVGLEISFQQLARHGMTALAIGTLGTLVPLFAGAGAVYAVGGIWGEQAVEHRFAYALFIGAAMANTANPVLARILFDLGLLKRDIGAMLMTATVVDDLVSWSLLAVVFGQFSSGGSKGMAGHLGGLGSALVSFVAVVAAGRWLIRPLVQWSQRALAQTSLAVAIISVFVLLTAALSEWIGLHAFLGPFVLGIGMAGVAKSNDATYQAMSGLVVGFFVPIYFVSMGLTSDFIRNFDVLLVALVLLVACTSKIPSVFIAARATGLDRRTALGVGFGMNARGAVGIILAALGREQGVINEPVYVALVLMAIITSIMAVPTMKLLLVDAHPPRGSADSPSPFDAEELIDYQVQH